MRATTSSALVLVALAGCGSYDASPRELPAEPAAIWRNVESPAGHFVISAPAAARRRVEREQQDGIVQYEIAFDDGERSYQVGYADLDDLAPDGADAFLDGLVGKVVSRSTLPLRERRSLRVDGGSARELMFAAPRGPFTRWRYLLVDRRLFQLGVISASDEQDLGRPFFSSFRATHAPQRVSLPEADLELELPSPAWQIVSRGPDGNGHWSAMFSDANARIIVHVERVPPETRLLEFARYRDSQDDFMAGERCAAPRGPSGELCNFTYADGPISLRRAVAGLRYRVVDGRRSDAYVAHAHYFDRGITIVLEAPSDEFAARDEELQRALQSVHAHPID
jgi:hypothetical protein